MTQRAKSVLNAVGRDPSISAMFPGSQSVKNVMTIVIRVKSSGASNTRNETELSTVASANGTAGNEEIQ